MPADFDPSVLDGATFSLNSTGEIKTRSAAQRLQAHPAPISQGSAGAGQPVVVLRQSLGGPLLPVKALSTRIIVTEGLGVGQPTLPAAAAQAAASSAQVITQLDGLEYRYVPFGASTLHADGGGSVAQPPRKRKREDKESGKQHDKKEKKHSKKEKKEKKSKKERL